MRLGAIHRRQPLAIRPLSKRANLHLMIPPRACDWHSYCPADGDALLNDRYGLCVPAADYRLIQLHRAVVWKDTTKPLVSDVVRRYSDLTGFNPVTGQPDNGTDTVDDMTHWCSQGIQIADQTLDVPLWTIANPADATEINLAINHCGPILMTLALPLAAQDLSAWATAPGTGSEWEAASWGFHRVVCGKFDGLIRTCRTWGNDVAMHPQFWTNYVMSADVVISRRWLNTTDLTPTGLDWDALKEDFASV